MHVISLQDGLRSAQGVPVTFSTLSKVAVESFTAVQSKKDPSGIR